MILFTTLDDTDSQTGQDLSVVRFNYDPAAVEIMKSVPLHRWDARRKQWATETSWVQLLAKRFTDAGYTVAIDGELWTPPNPKVLSPPLEALFRALPAHLRGPAFKALARVLHPDAGGDTKWMQELNKAAGK